MKLFIHFPDGSCINYPIFDTINLAAGTPSTYMRGEENNMVNIKDTPLSVTELSEYLKVSKQQIRKMIANKEIKSIKVGREYRVMESELQKWLNREASD